MNSLLQILLMILKIIGILLLAVLGAALLLLLLLLLVPIRYQGTGSWHEKPEGRGKVTWLFPVLSVQAIYRGELELIIRVLGIRLFRKKKNAAEDAEALPADGAEAVSDTAKAISNAAGSVSDTAEARTEAGEPAQDSREPHPGSGKELELSIQELPEEEASDKPDNPVQAAGKEPPLKQKFRAGKEKLSSILDSIRGKLQMIKGKIQDGKALYQTVSEFLADEKNQTTLKLIKRQLFKILRHLFPQRLRGNVTLGLEDPYTMGQVAGGAAFLYPLLRDRVTFTPVFGEKVIDGELTLKGRIRAGTVLCLAGRVLLNKNFRIQLKKILNRGGKKDGR